jgi:hypothetical protein
MTKHRDARLRKLRTQLARHQKAALMHLLDFVQSSCGDLRQMKKEIDRLEHYAHRHVGDRSVRSVKRPKHKRTR